MLYVIILILIAVLAWREWQHDRERRHLLNRIQAPAAAQAAAANEILGDPDADMLTEEGRIRRKAEQRGLSADQLRIPPGWV